MLPIQYAYPEDRNGTNPANRIVNERHTITPANGTNFNFLIPRAAPYFESSMVVTHVASGNVLVKGIDWVPSYKFEMASNTPPFLQVFGSISILTTSYNGSTISLEYQTLGGGFVLAEADVTTVLTNTAIDPRLASWESVTMVPGVYLPEAHLHHIVDTVGYAELVAAVTDFKDHYIIESGRLLQILNAHVDDLNNPHESNLVKLGIERFQDVFLATIENIDSNAPSQLNYVSAFVLKFYLEGLRESIASSNEDIEELRVLIAGNDEDIEELRALIASNDEDIEGLRVLITAIQGVLTAHNERITEVENRITDINNLSGDAGDLLFFTGESGFLKVENDLAFKTVGVVHNATELTAQLEYRESFQEVFNNWRRIAFGGANNPNHSPTEFNGWSYNQQEDRIYSTINSVTVIGMVAPEPVSGDFVFEVTVGSTNGDDDRIGLMLGPVRSGGVDNIIFIYRSIEGPRLLNVTLNYGGTTNRATLGESNTDLMWPDGVIDNSRRNNADGPGNFYGGWNNYQARGDIPLKVERIGDQLIVSTGNPGELTYVPGATITIDLAANPLLQGFRGPVNLGYAAQSQAASYWNTLRRTGANAPIAALHTARTYVWDGLNYVQSPTTVPQLLERGRFYLNPLTKRLYFTTAAGVPTRVGNDAISKDHSKTSSVLDRVTYIDNDGRAITGQYVDHWHQNPTNGAMTYRGHTAKLDDVSYDIRSVAVGATSSVWLGDSGRRYAGIRAHSDGSIGFAFTNQTRPVYLDPNGVLQHSGFNRTSDRTVKAVGDEVDYAAIDLSTLKLFYFKWLRDDRISETLWDIDDCGVMAQDVQKIFPHCVTVNPTNGLLTIDDSKLATAISIVLLKQLEHLMFKE